jgi:hypothetical protein
MKLYEVLPSNFNKIPKGLIPMGSIVHVGVLSVFLALTDAERDVIKVPLKLI